MNAAATDPANTTDLTRDAVAWDDAVRVQGGHLLQSWHWGAFKEQFGWEVERFAVRHESGVAMAQVLFRHKAGLSIGYVPRGPVLTGETTEPALALWRLINASARRRRTLTIVIEPNSELAAESARRLGLRPGPDPIQPSRTVKTELVDDAGLLAQMHAKTRYNVRMAKRRNVSCRLADDINASMGQFYGLLRDTASRNAFDVHSIDYYRSFMHLFDQHAALMFAEIDGTPVAGVMAAVFGDEAIYMYGASSTHGRANGAAFLLQHEAMRWARDRGAKRYDLWGIPKYDPTSTVAESGDRLARSAAGDWRGLYEFKTRFGGQIVTYPRPLERRYHPFLTALARRVYSLGGSG